MAAYQIETVTATHEVGMILTFWGNVKLLKKDGRSFSRYHLKSKETPSPANGWSLESYTFPQVKKITLKKGETIDSVKDELGNVYYEVTSII